MQEHKFMRVKKHIIKKDYQSALRILSKMLDDKDAMDLYLKLQNIVDIKRTKFVVPSYMRYSAYLVILLAIICLIALGFFVLTNLVEFVRILNYA